MTSGTRYAFVPFLYDADGARTRKDYLARAAAAEAREARRLRPGRR